MGLLPLTTEPLDGENPGGCAIVPSTLADLHGPRAGDRHLEKRCNDCGAHLAGLVLTEQGVRLP